MAKTMTMAEAVKEQALRCRLFVEEADKMSADSDKTPQEALEQLLTVRFSKARVEREKVEILQLAYMSIRDRLRNMIQWLKENKGGAREIERIEVIIQDIGDKIEKQSEALAHE